jgi:membrane protease YdiL (CAAX protease family)
LFGLVHIVKHAPPLNWQYALLATGAGFAYGWVYNRTGKLAAAAVTHGVVDWLWSTWLGS